MHTPPPVQTVPSSDSMHDFRDPSGGGRSAAVAVSHGTPRKTAAKTLDALTSEFLAGSRCATEREGDLRQDQLPHKRRCCLCSCDDLGSVQPLDCSNIAKSPKGLQVLARARAWRVVLEVSEQILQQQRCAELFCHVSCQHELLL